MVFHENTGVSQSSIAVLSFVWKLKFVYPSDVAIFYDVTFIFTALCMCITSAPKTKIGLYNHTLGISLLHYVYSL